MDQKHIPQTKRRVLKGLIISASVLLVITTAALLMIHSYIRKMHLVSSPGTVSAANSEAGDTSDTTEEDVNTQLPDSSANEINSLDQEIINNMNKNSIPILKDKDVFNVLLIGSDTRKVNGAGRSDVMILVSINKHTKEIVLTSFLRDIYLKIPGRNNNRVNAAYAFGGAELLMETLKQNFNIEIDQYASIDFFSFIDIVDAVGGVTIDVTDKEIPVINGYIKEINKIKKVKLDKYLLKEPGKLHLNGTQALAYSRDRYIGNGDFERTERQRRVLKQVFEKVKNLNVLKLKKLMDVVLPQVTTNLSEGQMFSLILSSPTYVKYNVKQWSIPVKNSYKGMRIRGMAVLGIDFEENKKELSRRIYGKDAE